MTTRYLKDVFEEISGPFTFGKFLRGSRTGMDMTQVQMAKFLKISKSMLCDIEKERQFVSPALAAKIAKKCDYPIEIAIKACLDDQLRRAGLKLVTIVKAA